MAAFTEKQIVFSDINGGQQYTNGQTVDANAINAPIQASAWAQRVAQEAKTLAEAASGTNTEAFFEAIRSIAAPLHKLMFFDDENINPAEIYGGYWLRVKDAFIWASGDKASITYTQNGTTITEKLSVGSRGGEVNHKLIISEIPNHFHAIANGGTSGKSVRPWVAGSYPHNANESAEWKNMATLDTNAIGGDAAHNNMPPYYAANAWVRVTEEEFNANESL